MQDGLGYRTEVTYGSGVRNADEVMAFESIALCNTDILKYLLDNTGYIQNYELRRTMYDLINVLDYESYNLAKVFGFTYYDDEACKKLFKRILAEINSVTGLSLKYALWLADYNVVENLYEGSPDDIDTYHVSSIIIDDLGVDGVLYLYEEMPKPITDEEFM